MAWIFSYSLLFLFSNRRQLVRLRVAVPIDEPEATPTDRLAEEVAVVLSTAVLDGTTGPPLPVSLPHRRPRCWFLAGATPDSSRAPPRGALTKQKVTLRAEAWARDFAGGRPPSGLGLAPAPAGSPDPRSRSEPAARRRRPGGHLRPHPPRPPLHRRGRRRRPAWSASCSSPRAGPPSSPAHRHPGDPPGHGPPRRAGNPLLEVSTVEADRPPRATWRTP